MAGRPDGSAGRAGADSGDKASRPLLAGSRVRFLESDARQLSTVLGDELLAELPAFLATRGGAYEVDLSLCDFYGRNVTYNPGGYLGRVA